jgi:hypothetical protein
LYELAAVHELITEASLHGERLPGGNSHQVEDGLQTLLK